MKKKIFVFLLVVCFSILSQAENIWFLDKMKSEQNKIHSMKSKIEYKIFSGSTGAKLLKKGTFSFNKEKNEIIVEYKNNEGTVTEKFKYLNGSFYIFDKKLNQYKLVLDKNNANTQMVAFDDFYQYNFLQNYMFKKEKIENLDGIECIKYIGRKKVPDDNNTVEVYINKKTGLLYSMNLLSNGLISYVNVKIQYKTIKGIQIPVVLSTKVKTGPGSGRSLIKFSDIKVNEN